MPPLMVADKRAEARGIVVYALVVGVVVSGVTALFAALSPGLIANSTVMQGAVAVAGLLLIPRALSLLRTGI